MSAQEEITIYHELQRCRPWIESALERSGGTHLFEDIVKAVVEGRMQLWPADDACAVTEIIVFPRKKVLHVFLAGGKLETIVDMNDSAEVWARSLGCDGMSIAGRKGWVKVLKKKGWKESFVNLALEV
jgi:hypothetical protein